MKLCLLFLLGLLGLAPAQELRLPALFGDNACVQAGKPLTIGGWAKPGDTVTVTLAGSTATAQTGADGRWLASLPAVKAGGPYTLTVKAGGQEIESHNIVAGEVWLASGQSNMFFRMAETTGGAEEIAAAHDDQLRLFRIDVTPSAQPATEPDGHWELCTPESVRPFSGVAYYFGRNLRKELGVPVGLIESSLGGTFIEAWLPESVWHETPELEKLKADHDRANHLETERRYVREHQEWETRGKKGPEPVQPPASGAEKNDCSTCFNPGIAPIAGYGLAGFLWYQGESNAGHPANYGMLLKLLVTRWRALWSQGDLPFYVVQLPNIGKPTETPVIDKNQWNLLREQQATILSLPNTGLVVTIDVGGVELHPPNKRPVGERLARLALAKVYGKPLVPGGPVLLQATPNGSQLTLRFENAKGLRLDPQNRASGFFIAGDDRIYYPATAKIEGETVILFSPSVATPKTARYLWATNPHCTLFNGEGLPAGPFRTDSF